MIVYLGMMAGAFVLGGLADKLGRKRALSMSLALNASFASLSSFVQGYGGFLFCRLISGIGYVTSELPRKRPPPVVLPSWSSSSEWHLHKTWGCVFVCDFQDTILKLTLRKGSGRKVSAFGQNKPALPWAVFQIHWVLSPQSLRMVGYKAVWFLL